MKEKFLDFPNHSFYEYEGNVFPQVKIWYYDSEEYKLKPNEIEDDWVF